MKVPNVDLGGEHAELWPALAPLLGDLLARGDYTLGDEVATFERRFAQRHGSSHAVGVASGTEALTLTLRALGVGPGDEVVTVANSFIATASSIVATGATPVFVDVGADENIDPDLIAGALTERTRAILPVHLRGRPARMDAVTRVAQTHRLPVVEDCAQAVLACYQDRPVGAAGTAGCFSMHALKNLGACGDAGLVVTEDARLAGRLRLLRNHGLQDRDTCLVWGANGRLDTMQAVILNHKLESLGEKTRRRREIAARYLDAFADLPLELPREAAVEYCVYYLFVIRTTRRDLLKTHLEAAGVDARVHYPVPIHLQPAAAGLGYPPGSLPRTERQSREILALPIYPLMTDAQVSLVIDAVRGFDWTGVPPPAR